MTPIDPLIGGDISPGRIQCGSMKDRLMSHLFEMGVAITWLLIGANYLFDRQSSERSFIGEVLPNYDIWWNSSYVVAGPLVIVGLFRVSQRVRVAGLVLLGSGLLMNGIAALAIDPIELRDGIYWVYASICGIKAWLGFRDVVPKVPRAPE